MLELCRRLLCLSFLSIISLSSFAQSATMTTSGNWNVATNWSSSNIGDLVTEAITINSNINPTVINGTSFTVGNVTLSNNNTLNVNSGGTLNIGDATHTRTITTNNNTNITVAGTLVIWGDMNVNNNIVWNITGTVIIKGNVVLGNNANITVTGGSLNINGNLTGNNNNNISVPSGSVTVGGNVSISNGSNLNGCGGCFHMGGTCSGPASFCGSSVLPITLDYFKGKQEGSVVNLEWSTLAEINLDYFVIEHSTDGFNLLEIGRVRGSGNSETRKNYSFTHETPSTGKNFYRIASVDFDRAVEYSPEIAVNVEAGRMLQVYPNPASESITVKVNFEPAAGDEVFIYDEMGMKIAVFPMESNATTIPVGGNIGDGFYWVKCTSQTEIFVARFMVSGAR